MATQYGYRLFVVEVTKGMRRKHESYEKAALGSGASEVQFIDSILRTCATLKDVTITEALKYREKSYDVPDGNSAVEDTTPFLRLLSYSHDGNRLDFSFRYGRKGSHDLAMAATTEGDAELDDKAPTNPYRAHLYLPVSGSRAILAIESRNRTCPAHDFLKLIGVSTKLQDEERTDESKIGWWRFIPSRMTDSLQWERFIMEGKAQSVSLIKYYMKSDGTRGSKEVTLRQDGLPEGKLAQALAIGRYWIGKSDDAELRSAGIDPDDSTVEQLASMVEVGVDPDEFDEAGFNWTGADGVTKFIDPDRVRDYFTYPVGRRGYSPKDEELRYAIESRLVSLAPTHEIELDL